MVSTSGAVLLPQDAVRELRKHLLHVTTILTPNVPEARLLLEDAGEKVKEPESVDDILNIAKAVQGLGSKWVLVKGGHLPLTKNRVVAKSEEEKELMVDVLYGEGQTLIIESKYQQTKNTHGTGCSLACKTTHPNHISQADNS